MGKMREAVARRVFFIIVLVLATSGYALTNDSRGPSVYESSPPPPVAVLDQKTGETPRLAREALETLAVKGRAPKTGYSRQQFGGGWAQVGSCDVRNIILQRDMTDTDRVQEDNCRVLSGTLNDPYTGKIIKFQYGKLTSQAVQIDHVVALSDAWQKGAQALTEDERELFANDALNLLAVDGPANVQKGDGDAATWLPPNKDYRCRYVARQIAVKAKYRLWVTAAERDAMRRVLHICPDQQLPIVN